MLEFEYADAISSVFCDKALSEKTRSLRLGGIAKLHAIARFYVGERFDQTLIKAFWDKKVRYIMEANSNTEVKGILKPSVPAYNGSTFYHKTPYHVDEEELMLWACVSPYYKLKAEAQDRYKELFSKFFPEIQIMT